MTEEKYEDKSVVYKMEDCLQDMLYDLRTGKVKGSTTHIPDLDQCWTWRKQEFNIWTGYSNEGKSSFLRFISIVKALASNWKIAFCAPEDYPPKEFYDDMIHTIGGLSTDKDNPYQISEELYLKAVDRVKNNVFFVDVPHPNNTIMGALSGFKKLMEKEQIDACVIDPLIKFSRPKGFTERDDIYASYITTLCTEWCRKNNISLHLVMHQLTPRLDNDGFYPKPSMYSIKGGGTWADGTDNILSIWRPKYAKDKLDDEVIFTSNKIKKQKLVGIPQDFKMRFNRKSNRYTDFNIQDDLFDFRHFKKIQL